MTTPPHPAHSIFAGKLAPVRHKTIVPTLLTNTILREDSPDLSESCLPEYNLIDGTTYSISQKALGTNLQHLSRSILRRILFYLSPLEWLLNVAPLSKYHLMLVSEPDDWRQYVLDQFGGDFWYVRSWRFTYINEFFRRHHWGSNGEVDNPFRDSMSDMITLVSRASIDAARLPKLQPDSIRRVRRISKEEFIENYAQIAEPVIITGAMDHWVAMKEWQKERFVEKYGHLKFRTDQSYTKTGTSVKVRLDSYYQYMTECREDEDPVYIFDPKFSTRTKEYLSLGDEYCVEDYFTEDLMSVLGEKKRPRYKWLVLGTKNSGTSFHIDPYQTSAWNALICGRKRWAFYLKDHLPKHLRKGKPRRTSPSNAHTLMDSDNLSTNSCTRDSFKPLYKCKSYEPVQWFSEFYPQSFIHGEAPRECIQHPGEIIFVPGGWWHNVLNLDDTIAVTQNMANTQNFRQVFYEIWDYDKRLGRKIREGLLQEGRGDLFANLGIDFDETGKTKRKRRKMGDDDSSSGGSVEE